MIERRAIRAMRHARSARSVALLLSDSDMPV